jgi:hypothetical protein
MAPKNHFQRSSLVSNDSLLQLVSAKYKQLQDWAHLSRYEPTFHASPEHVLAALSDLAIVATRITTALSSSA